ncbi:hypothetical protein GL279_18755 [Paracoccus limosus]|uniref:Phage major capsid protein n=1 Tax=Paracoccus limosus TaxID=913252 RepID=A0A844H754_9RHOB|nr:hypothetical protein [Paracoccus limosus]MTH36622.1 hypothetical protein [Paracoccus limosus]
MSMFDRQASCLRSVVGQYLTRNAAHPAADQWANETLVHAFDAAQRAAAERNLKALTMLAPQRPPGTEKRFLEVLQKARRAMPFVDVDYGTGDGRGYRRPKPAADIMRLQIGEDHLSNFDAPAANLSSERLTVSEAVLARSRVMRAGAHLVVAPKPGTTRAGTAEIPLQAVPVGLTLTRPAPFALIPDLDESPVPVSPLSAVMVTDKVQRPDDLATHAFRVSLKRSEINDRPDDELINIVLHAIILGLADAVDRELLGAILASDPGMFTLGRAAAKGLTFGELRAIVGTDEPGAGLTPGPGYGDAAGQLFLNSIPAELASAADRTVIAAFDKFGISAGPEITLLVERTAADGSVTLTCFCELRTVIPDDGFAWVFQAPAVTP